MSNKYLIFSFIFPLVVYVKYKKTLRGILLHLIAFIVTYLAMIDLKYVFTIPNNYIIENLIIVNLVLWGMYGLMVRDSIQTMRKYVVV